MRKQLLMKTFLVAVSMLVGTSAAWADATTVYERGYDTNWSSSDIGSGNWGGNAYFQEGQGIKLSGKGG